MAWRLPGAAAGDQETAPDPRRVLVGLVGRGIQLSRTPAMHEAEGRAQGLAYVYRLLDTDRWGRHGQLADLLAFAGHFGFDGLNVTFPYKQEIIPLLDQFSEAAQAARLGKYGRAARRPPHWPQHRHVGIQGEFPRRDGGRAASRVLLLGAGGAGAAVAHALLDSGVGSC